MRLLPTVAIGLVMSPPVSAHDYVLKAVNLGDGYVAHALNNHSQVVGDTMDGPWIRAFLWSEEEGVRLLSSPFGVQTKASAINESGDIVGSYQDLAGTWRPCVWWNGVQFQDLGLLPGAKDGCAAGVSNGGIVYGNYSIATGVLPFRYSLASGLAPVEVPWGVLHEKLLRVGPAGRAIGDNRRTNQSNGRTVPYWTDATLCNSLKNPSGATEARAGDVNQFGEIAGSALIGKVWKPVVWASDGTPFLNTLPVGYVSASAHGINIHGDTVGVMQPGNRGYVREDHGMIDLNLNLEPSGEQFVVNEAINFNDSGQVLAQSGPRSLLLRPVIVQWTEADDLTLTSGRVSYGHQGGLRLVDREPMIFESTLRSKSNMPVIEFVAESQSTFVQPHEITFRLVARQPRAEQARLTVEMFDWSLGRYDTVDVVSVTVPQERYERIDYRCTGDLRRYSRASDRLMRARVRVDELKVSTPWSLELDQMVWIVR